MRKALKILNELEIPKRGILIRKIVPDLYYIIWEKNILKPRVFKYAFADDYHAKKFAMRYLFDNRYNVLIGQTLLDYGIDISIAKVREAAKIKQQVIPLKYALHPDLPFRRKKTLRTLYRRNQRRLLLKLLNMQNTRKHG